MKLSDIVYESGKYYVHQNKKEHFEVYRLALSGTHAIRCAYIGFTGAKGLERARKEIERRELEDRSQHCD